MRKRLVGLLLVGALVGGCSDRVVLPDRTDPAVQAEETRIAEVLASTDDIWVPGPCAVRLLGQEGDTSYAYAVCAGYEWDGAPEMSAWGGPVRMDGDRVSQPRDGSVGVDLREMFPADLAEAIIDGGQDLYP